MKIRIAHLICATSLTTLTCASAKAQLQGGSGTASPGQVRAPATNDNIGEIIVTAQKRSESVNRVPMSIDAATGAQLQNLGIKGTEDLARIVPGFNYVESGTSVPVYSLRGVGFFDTSLGARPSVAVYQDEASLPFSIMTTGASLDLERVEVLKGPQGTLFGQNATGGAINYIAAKPTSTFKAGGEVSYGRFNELDARGYVSGPLSSNLDARIALRSDTADGWQKSYTRDDTLGKKRLYQARVQLRWQPSSRLTASLMLNGFVDRSDTQAGQLIAVVPTTPSKASFIPDYVNYPKAPASDRAADWDPGAKFDKDNRFYQAVGRLDFDVSDHIVLTSLTNYSHIEVDQRIDSDGSALSNWINQTTGYARSVSQEVRLTGTGTRLNWIAGVNYSHDKTYEFDATSKPYSTGRYALLPFGTLENVGQIVGQTFDSVAAFGNVDYKIANTITMHGGVRYTRTNLDYFGCANGDATTSLAFQNLYNALRPAGSTPVAIAAGQCVTANASLTPMLAQGKLDQDNISWRVGLDWQPTNRILLYTNVSRGYKAGSAPSLPGLRVEQYQPVTQESLTAYEAGFKVGLLDHKLQLNAAYFYYDYKNKQLRGRQFVIPNVFGALEALVNVPKSHISGAEAQVTATPSRWFTANLGATYIVSKVDGSYVNYTILGASADFGGEAFPYTPKWQIVGDAEARQPIGNLEGFLGGGFTYHSSTTGGFGDSDLLAIDSYTTIDARVGVKGAGWRFTLYAKNLTNKYYWTNVAKISDGVRRLAGMPATYGARLSFDL